MSAFKKRLSLTAITISFLFNASSATAAESTAWKFNVAPYLWAINMNGTVQTGPVRAHVDDSFQELLQHLNIGGMLFLEANRGKFGIFGNAVYSVVSTDGKDGPLKSTSKNKFGIFSGGVSYAVHQFCFSSACDQNSLTVEPYAGFRYTLNDTTVTLQDLPIVNLRSSNNQKWTDPIVGARLRYLMTKAWSLTLAGDIGGTNAKTQHSYNVIGLLGYKPQSTWKNTNIYLGYRVLDQYYKNGQGEKYFLWNMKISGPVLGINFTL
jgi:hypothetical protein